MRIKLGMALSYEEIARVCFTKIMNIPKILITHICTDSRECQFGDLFVPLNGEKACGEEFIEEAISKGAYTLSTRNPLSDFICSDTEKTLLEIAKIYKKKLKNLKETVAITGSVGKTTTKEYINSILSVKYKTHATHENFNNFIGLSFTILTAPQNTEILVLEMGMNHKGEIEALSLCANPTYSIITNVGSCHLGNFGSRELIAKAKLEILAGMSDGILISPFGETLLKNYSKFTFSTDNANSDFYFVTDNKTNKFTFRFKNNEIFNFSAPCTAKHHLQALCCALTIGHLLNLNEHELSIGTERTKEIKFRQRLITLPRFQIYDDTYSSSPEAIEANFQFIDLIAKNRRKACILGDMLELGARTEELHKHIGILAANYAYSQIYAFGIYAPFISLGALNAGFKKENIFINNDITHPEITAHQVCENAYENSVILAKASHALHAENIIKEIKRIENCDVR